MPSSGVQTCALDRKSTRLNSSHTIISYAVFCLKKQKFAGPAERSPGPFDAAGDGRHGCRRAHTRGLGSATRRIAAGGGIGPLPVPFFFNDTATAEIATLSLHDALPI